MKFPGRILGQNASNHKPLTLDSGSGPGMTEKDTPFVFTRNLPTSWGGDQGESEIAHPLTPTLSHGGERENMERVYREGEEEY
jgi:hypothetical protein